MADNRQVFVPKNALSTYVNALYSDRLEMGTREPTFLLDVDINQKNPSYSTVIARTTHFLRGEDKNKHYEIKTKPWVIVAALEKLKAFSEIPFSDDEEKTHVWEIRGNKIVNGKMTNEKVSKGKLVVGRKKKGVFISVVSWNTNYPLIAFYPGLCDAGSVIPVSGDDQKKLYEYVCSCAVGYATHMISQIEQTWYHGNEAVIAKLKAEQNSGGYGNNNNGGYGGYNDSNDEVVSYASNGDGFKF